MDNNKRAREKLFVEIDGVKAPPFFSEECFRSAMQFQAQPGDIFVVTYPKSGTTWMQNVLLNILRKGQKVDPPVDFFRASPFLEQLGAEDSRKWMISPGVFKTHLPAHKCPWSVDCKYVYVARHPKDVCVSFFHHMCLFPGYGLKDGTLDEKFVNKFIEDASFFEHVIPWYERRHLPNVYFTTFEAMKKDLRQVVLEVSAFLNIDSRPYLDQILHNCSFEEIRAFMRNAMTAIADPEIADTLPKGRQHAMKFNRDSGSKMTKNSNLDFVRKGQVESWKEELSEDQCAAIDRMIEKYSCKSDIMELWKD